MKSFIRCTVLFCAILLILKSGYAADSLTVMFRYTDTSHSAFYAFVPGEFNNWGPGSGGVIPLGAPAEMQFVNSGGYWQKPLRLEVGKSYSYKFFVYHDSAASDYQWLPDPLNPLTDGSIYGNSLVAVADPMIFESAAYRNSGSSIVKILSGAFSTAGVSTVTLFTSSDSIDITSSFNDKTGIISYTPATPIVQSHPITMRVLDGMGRLASYTFPTPVSSNRKLDISFLFHANQNLVPYGKVADRVCFRGLLQTLRKHPTQKFQIHFSATTIHDLQWFNDTTLQVLRAGIQDGQFEIFGSTYAQNVMYSTRVDSNDFEFNDHQIKFQKALIQKVLGVTPKAFWNPERVWTQNFVQLLADNGYQYAPVEDHILQASGKTGPVYQPRTTHYNGRQINVFEDNPQFLGLVDAAINTGAVTPVMDFLHAKYAEDTNDTYIIGYYEDAEATGLWDFEQGVNPETNFDNLDKLLTAIEQDTLISVTTYDDYLASAPPPPELTPIVDGAAAWMGSDAWFTENQNPAFQVMRRTFDTLRLYLDSVAQVIGTFPGDTAAAGTLLHHAWFTLCAHQFEFGCHGSEGDTGHTGLQLARTCAVAATAALYALHPVTGVFNSDINRDGVNEILMVTPRNLYVFSALGGRLLYWFDLVKGEELVGNENFMADYIESYVSDNNALPLIRGGIETYPWIGGTTILPEVLQWTFIVRKHALNDLLTVSPAAAVTLDNTHYGVSVTGSQITFSTTVNGIRLKKIVMPDSAGIHVTYRLISALPVQQNVQLEIQNSFCPSLLEVMDNGRKSLAYWSGSDGVTPDVTTSTTGVINTVTLSCPRFDWESGFTGLAGKEDVFGLELNPSYYTAIKPGDSVDYSFSLRNGGKPPMAASVPIERNWNMVSLPLTVDTGLVSSVFKNATSQAFRYQGSYKAVDTLKPGVGYWLKFGAAQHVPIAGSSIFADTVDVVSGWNMIGSISAPISAMTIVSDPPGLVTSNFFKYSGNRYGFADTIYPGSGYWVKVNQTGRLVLSVTPSQAMLEKSAIHIAASDELPPHPPASDEIPATAALPKEYSLEQNYPNPFNPNTVIKFSLPVQSHVQLTIYNTLGQVVSRLVDADEEAGYKSFTWSPGGIGSGVYYYRLEATSIIGMPGTYEQTRKMIIVK
jgi:hypothetical protein